MTAFWKRMIYQSRALESDHRLLRICLENVVGKKKFHSPWQPKWSQLGALHGLLEEDDLSEPGIRVGSQATPHLIIVHQKSIVEQFWLEVAYEDLRK